MIIKKITIENFLCYYGVNEFNLAEGLNIILGDNGEGKTKFFESLDWLFNGSNRNLDQLVSARALDKVNIGEQFRVKVSIIAYQYGEKKVITRSFIAQKTDNDDCLISNFSIEGIEENNKGERVKVDGDALLDRIFPPEIRRYSMFKGESELNIFHNKEALSILINSFSSAKYFQKYADKGTFLKNKAERAINDAAKKNIAKQREYDNIEYEIKKLNNQQLKIRTYSDSNINQIDKVEENIEDAEKYVDNADALETINKRIKGIENDISNLNTQIDENYTTLLFDENWLLVNFEKIHKEYSVKVSTLSSKRRKMQSDFDKQVGIDEGKKQLKAELLNNSIPLPEGVPSKAHMEEMIKDKVCKVCNTPAPIGSDQYNFMLKRLEEYLKSQEPIKSNTEENKVLFKNDYTNRLVNLSVSQEDNLSELRKVRTNIKDYFEFNKERKNDIEDLKVKLDIEISEREKIIGSSSVSSDKLSNILKNYNAWQRDLLELKKEEIQNEKDLKVIETELLKLDDKKDKIDTETANTFLIKTREILRDVETIFVETKNSKFDEFIELLEEKSNIILQKINVDDFTGKIVFNKKKIGEKTFINVMLHVNGRKFHKPNESLETSMHIAILFAISELASDIREENFPMIFDAPTSSFGEPKTKHFLDLIFGTKKQRIIAFYDFVGKNEDGVPYIKPEFKDVKRDKAFWIKRQRPFIQFDLTTINTDVIPL
jgi:DNA sulfur modification protein DndD